jgi:hypothetical protein
VSPGGDDPLDRVLGLVAEGKLTAVEAAPIIEALQESRGARTGSDAQRAVPAGPAASSSDADPGRQARFARVEVRESGRKVVDLRVPISLGRFALARVPGLSAEHLADVEAAIGSGAHGPILDVQDQDGDGVRIILE